MFIFLILLLSQTAQAIPNYYDAKQEQILSERKVFLTPKLTHKKLARAHKFMGDKSSAAKAFSILNSLKERVKARPYELALVEQTLGYAYSQTEQFKKAQASFQRALDLNILSAAPTKQIIYMQARLNTSLQNYKEAENQLKKWFAITAKPSAQAYVLMARVLYEQKNKLSALEHVDYAIAQSSSPKEDWLQLSVALNFELKKYAAAASSLEKLVNINPTKKTYWKQLSGTYMHLNVQDKSLAALELARKWGHLETEVEHINLISLFLMQNYPYPAAILLQKWILDKTVKPTQKNYEILAQAWLQAEEGEKALVPLEKAAHMAKEGNLWAQCGQLRMDMENWPMAIKAFQKALIKGQLKNPGVLNLSLGIAKFNTGDAKGAQLAFKQALKVKRTGNAAQQWLQHISMHSTTLD